MIFPNCGKITTARPAQSGQASRNLYQFFPLVTFFIYVPPLPRVPWDPSFSLPISTSTNHYALRLTPQYLFSSTQIDLPSCYFFHLCASSSLPCILFLVGYHSYLASPGPSYGPAYVLIFALQFYYQEVGITSC